MLLSFVGVCECCGLVLKATFGKLQAKNFSFQCRSLYKLIECLLVLPNGVERSGAVFFAGCWQCEQIIFVRDSMR